MRVSAKGRYALAAMAYMAGSDGGNVTIARISEALGVSKIYLEQTFSLLRRAKLVVSVKGAQGGYRLARPAHGTTAWDVLSAIESGLLEATAPAVRESAPGIDAALRSLVFTPLDAAVQSALRGVSLAALAEEARKDAEGYMFFI